MTRYEFVFLLNDQEELQKIKELIGSFKGKVGQEKSWGKKSLAFPIKKAASAHFYEWQLDIDSKHLSEVKKKLNFNEKLLRYLLLKEE